MAEESLGRAVAVAALAPIAGRLADQDEREERAAELQRQFEEALAAVPALERPAPPNTWVGEPWPPSRVALAVVWVLGKAFLWCIPLVLGGALVVAIFFGGSEAMTLLFQILGIGAAIAIAAYEPAKVLREEAERRRRVAEGKEAYARAARAFDDREAERAAVRARFGKPEDGSGDG